MNMSESENVRIHFWSNPENVRIGKRQNQKMSDSELVRIGKCQNPSKPENVKIWKCQNPSEPDNVRIWKCQNFSKPENVRIWKCQNSSKPENVRILQDRKEERREIWPKKLETPLTNLSSLKSGRLFMSPDQHLEMILYRSGWQWEGRSRR